MREGLHSLRQAVQCFLLSQTPTHLRTDSSAYGPFPYADAAAPLLSPLRVDTGLSPAFCPHTAAPAPCANGACSRVSWVWGPSTGQSSPWPGTLWTLGPGKDFEMVSGPTADHGVKDQGSHTQPPNQSQRESSLPRSSSPMESASHTNFTETKSSRTQGSDSSSLEMVLISTGGRPACSTPCWPQEEGTGL